jgi:putative glutamine amidotransferase
MDSLDKPLILIPTPVQDAQRRSFSMGKGYISSLIAAGAVPLMAPVTLDTRELRALYEMAAGVMLAGGGDVDPATYGEAAHEKTQGIDVDRDRAEFELSRWAVQDDKPLLGICRGIQSLNVALGGTLIQDIPALWAAALHHNGHYEQAARDEVLHTVCVEAHTRTAQMVAQQGTGDLIVGVNSFHHQAVKAVADGFVITSRAPDGIIEAMEMPDKRFVVAVQWHPEEMSATREDMVNLFVTFAQAAAE